jgi:hypothetical protein
MNKLDMSQSKDLINSLQLEFSATNPQQRHETQPLVDSVHNEFMRMWGQYIPKERLEIASLSIRNPILTDRAGMKSPIKKNPHIIGLIEQYNQKRLSTDGYVEYIDDVGIIKLYPHGEGFNKYPEKMVQETIKKYSMLFDGDLKKAAEYLKDYFFQSVLAHESAHACSTESIPSWFQEYGARYYQTEIMSKLYGAKDPQTSISMKNHKDYKIYTDLISQYGDVVHKFFFGGDIDPKIKRSILIKSHYYMIRDFTKEYFAVKS